MKKKARRLIALLLTFSMALSMLSSTAWATSIQELTPEAAAPLSETETPVEETTAPEEEAPAEEQEPAEGPAAEETPVEESAAEEAPVAATAYTEAAATQDNNAGTATAEGKTITGYSKDDIKSIIKDNVLSGGTTVIDLSPYGITGKEMNTMTTEVLEETSMTTFAEVNYDTDEEGNVTTMSADVDPTMATAFDEVDAIAEDSNTSSSTYTADDIKQAYAEYQKFKVDNADYFGVDVPFDTEKDIASPLGSMLDMASLDTNLISYIEAGYVGADDIDAVYGMVQLFKTGAQMGVSMYGDALLAAKDEAMSQLTDDMSDVEKLLVLNDWLSNWSGFSMESIMQDDNGDPIMTAPEDDPNSVTNQLINALTQQVGAEQAAVLGPAIAGYLGGNQFGPLALKRAVCAGYTYAYAYLVQWAYPEVYKNSDGSWKTWQDLNGGTHSEDRDEPVYGYVPVYDETTGKVATDENGDILYQVDDNGEYVMGQVPVTEERDDDPATEGVDESGTYVVMNNGEVVYQTAKNTYTVSDWSADAGYIVDIVKINFDTTPSMFGESAPFQSVHYWNAVKVNDEWYYVDTTYNDVYTEVMSRDRVEADGNMSHLYFLLSDTTCREMYDGYMREDDPSTEEVEKGLDTLYEGIATDKTYEDAWFAFANSPVYRDGDNWYYSYDSTDLIDMVGKFGNGSSSDMDFGNLGQGDIESLTEGADYQLVVHDGTKADSDASFTTLVDFNNAQVLDPATGTMVDNELIEELYAKQLDYEEIYPSIQISCALYNNVLYFNLANCILTYDLSTGEVVRLKEYNKVNAQRDLTNAMGGEAFTLVGDDVELDDEYDFTIYNPPVASMAIDKDTGEMTVSIASNFAFISGKDSVDDTSHYGYAYEQTNFNSSYNSFSANYDMSEYGEENEINDNDEFMWSANIVETISMSDLTGEHDYVTVTVAPTCGVDGFTEERDSVTGAINDGTRVYDEGTALDHHFVKYDETYYTKDDNGNFNTGTSYVCTICKYAVEEGDDEWDDSIAENAGHVYTAASDEDVTWSEDNTTATVTKLACGTCEGKKLDCVVEDDTVVIEDEVSVECTAGEPEISGTCDAGLTTTYTATGEYNGAKVVVTKTEQGEAGEHAYVGTFTWAEDYSSATADLECSICGDKQPDLECVVTPETTPATCEEDGKTVYTATATAENGQTVSDTKEETIPALGHAYGDPVWSDWTEDNTCTATFTCDNDPSHVEIVDADVTSETGDATCTEPGTIVYTATVEFNGKTYTNPTPKEVTGQALGHEYEVTWAWSDDFSSATATFTCVRGDDEQTAEATVTSETTVEPDCTSTGEIIYTATAVDPNGEEVTDNQSVIVPALGHVDEDEDTVCDRCGETLELSNVDTPVLTSIANSTTGVTVEWGRVTGALKYRVYRKVNGGSWAKVADTTSTSLTDTDVSSGTTYTYTVRCINNAATAYTSGYDTTGLSILYIAAPALSGVANGATGVTVKWNAVTGATKYRVYRKVSGGSWTNLGDTTSTSYTDTTAVSGTTYTYTVRGLNGSAGSNYDHTGKSIKYIAAPAISSVANDVTGVTVKWDAVTGAEKYRVYRKVNGGSWTKVADTSSTSLTDTDVSSGTTYTYTIRCINEAVTAYTSGYDSTGKSILYIAAPTLSGVANSATGVTVKWNAVSGATKYRVYRKVSGGSWTNLGDTTSTSYTDTTAVSGTTYTYTVRGLNGSAGSNYDHTGKSIKYIAAPKITSATNATSGITIKWGAVTGAENYRVYRKVNGGSWTKVADTTSTSLTDTNVVSGTTYTYTVRCINSAATAYTSGYDATGVSIKR